MPHNKFPDQREPLGLGNSEPNGQKVLIVEMDLADNEDDLIMFSF